MGDWGWGWGKWDGETGRVSGGELREGAKEG